MNGADCIVPMRRSLHSWAEVIQADMVRCLEGMLAAGQHLNEARTQHQHGEFLAWLDRGDCGLSRRTAYRLMELAEWALASNVVACDNIRQALPPVLSTLSELIRLDPEDLAVAVEEGKVHPEMTYRDARALTKKNEGHTRYTPEVREEVCRLFDDGKTIPEVVEVTGLPRGTVGGWRKKWADKAPAPVPVPSAQVHRFIREMSNTLDALVSSLELVDTRTAVPDPTTWPWLGSISESLKTLTRFSKELNRARDQQATTPVIRHSEDRAQGSSALDSHSPDAG
jgi:Protein of unknown function (DUF3102)